MINTLSARALAAIALLTIVMSAFPASVFLAEAATQSVIFSDSFESDPAFNIPAWEADPHWGTDNSGSRTGSSQAKVVGSDSGSQTLQTSIDTTGYENLTFSFWYKKLGMDNGDNIVVEWSDGADWNPVTTISGVNNDSDDSTAWEPWSGQLPAGADNNDTFALRFTSDMNSSGEDKFFLEDVNISGDALPSLCDANVTGHVGNDGPTVSGSITGDVDATISGSINLGTYVEGQHADFSGNMTGDISGTMTGGVNYNGQDTISAVITGTIETYYMIGEFDQPGQGNFSAHITCDAPELIDGLAITGATSVQVGDSIQMTDVPTIGGNPAALSAGVAWSVWSNPLSPAAGEATIDQNGLLTGVATGTVTVIASALDGSLITANYTVYVTPVTYRVANSVVVKQADLVGLTDLIASTTLYADPQSWFFYNDENDTIDNTLGSFVNGPDIAPVGDGSVQISVTGSERRNLATYQFSGTKLADITDFSYNTYNPSAGNGGSVNRSGYFQFNVDFTGGDTWQKRLLFEPTANGTVVQDTWQVWDMYQDGDALWSWSGLSGHGGGASAWPDGNTNEYRTWNELLTAFPNIAVRTTDSWMGVRVGSPYADGYTENIDGFTVGIKSGATTTISTYDFEPTNYCAVTVVSDETNTVTEKDGAFAKLLTYVHSAWTATIDGADWIWGDNPVASPTQTEVQTFVKKFDWSGGVEKATLEIAVDNYYTVRLNGVEMASSTASGLFRNENKDNIDVSSYIIEGENTLEIEATNSGVNGSNYKGNPAGLKYKLTIVSTDEGSACMYAPVVVDPSLTITSPATDGEVLFGEHTFTAEYIESDETRDYIDWAIRAGTCNANTGTVAGNVDGHHDAWDYSSTTFSTTIDMSAWADGDYCLVVNPRETSGKGFREERWFKIENPAPVASCVANVNLLANPSFEEPAITGTWSLVDPVGWLVKKLGSSIHSKMEIQHGYSGWLPSDGTQLAELDGKESDTFTQVIPTVADKSYTLSWDFSPRPGRGTIDNQLDVMVNGSSVDHNQANGVGLTNTSWTNHTYTFVGDGSDVEITFADGGNSDSYGTFLDNVSLTCNPNTGTVSYCGDGVIDDSWEQCELGDEGCTDTCQLDNQCHFDQLVKIDLNDTVAQSASFNGKVYIGANDKLAPVGYWFNVNEFGNSSAYSIAHHSGFDGLAIGFDGSDMQFAWNGGNKSKHIDYVQGNLSFLGFSDITNDDISGEINGTSYKLEWSGVGFKDVFETTSSSTIAFDMRADTGDDGVTLTLSTSEVGYSTCSTATTTATTTTATTTETTTTTSGGGGGGQSATEGYAARHGVGGSSPVGQVLGASTDMCPQYLTETIMPGKDNNPAEVTRLQKFLRDIEGYLGVSETGVYDAATQSAVGEFQDKYIDKVLTPWGINTRTLNVYYTTRKTINEIYCGWTREFPLSDPEQAEVDWYRKIGHVRGPVGVTEENNQELKIGAAADGEENNMIIGARDEASTNEEADSADQTAAVGNAGDGFFGGIGKFLKGLFGG